MLRRWLPRKLKVTALAALTFAAAASAGAQTPGATAPAAAEVAVRFNAYLKDGGDVPALDGADLKVTADGVDTASRRRLDEAARAAIRAGVVVYAIGVGDDKTFGGVSENDLRKLAGRTGGRAFFPKKAAEMPAVLAEVRGGLRSHYVVTFAAPAARRAGSFRKVEIEIANPELRRRGVRLSHPQGYFDD